MILTEITNDTYLKDKSVFVCDREFKVRAFIVTVICMYTRWTVLTWVLLNIDKQSSYIGK